MLLNLFYLFGLLILIFSFSNLINFYKFNKIRFWAKTFRKVVKRDVDKSDFKSHEEYNIFIIYSLFSFLEILWILFGISSSYLNHWIVFLSLISANVLVRIVYKYSNFLTSNIFGGLFSFLKFIIVLFLILNYFHFQQDILLLFR
jgi:hypothetical protein